MEQFLTREQWYSLPSDLRVRWYAETQFDRLPPSSELLQDVQRALQPQTTNQEQPNGL